MLRLAHLTIKNASSFLTPNFSRIRIFVIALLFIMLAYLILKHFISQPSYLLILWISLFSRILSHNFEGNISLVQTSRHDCRFNTNFTDFYRIHRWKPTPLFEKPLEEKAMFLMFKVLMKNCNSYNHSCAIKKASEV